MFFGKRVTFVIIPLVHSTRDSNTIVEDVLCSRNGTSEGRVSWKARSLHLPSLPVDVTTLGMNLTGPQLRSAIVLAKVR